MKNKVISDLISRKKSIFNCRIKVGSRKFQLAGVGSSSIKVKPTRLKNYPHLEIVGFLSWKDWDNFTKEEKALVEAFYNSLD